MNDKLEEDVSDEEILKAIRYAYITKRLVSKFEYF